MYGRLCNSARVVGIRRADTHYKSPPVPLFSPHENTRQTVSRARMNNGGRASPRTFCPQKDLRGLTLLLPDDGKGVLIPFFTFYIPFEIYQPCA